MSAKTVSIRMEDLEGEEFSTHLHIPVGPAQRYAALNLLEGFLGGAKEGDSFILSVDEDEEEE